MIKKQIKKLFSLLVAMMVVVQTNIPVLANEIEPVQMTNNVVVETIGSGTVTIQENGNVHQVTSQPLSLTVDSGTTMTLTVTANEGNEITEVLNNSVRISQFTVPTNTIQFDLTVTSDSLIQAYFNTVQSVEQQPVEEIPAEESQAEEEIKEESPKSEEPKEETEKPEETEAKEESYDVSAFSEGFNGFGYVPSVFSMARAGELTITGLTEHTWINGVGNMFNGLWTLSNGKYAFCGEGMKAPPGAGQRTSAPILVNDANVRKALYYGYKGAGDVLSGPYGKEGAIVLTNEALSYAYSGTCLAKESSNGYHWNLNVRDIVHSIYAKPDPAEFGAVAYRVDVPGWNTNWQGQVTECQDLFYIDVAPTGKLQISKKSANPEITDGNDCYGTMEGAEYNVYKNSNATGLVGTLKIEKDNKSNVLSNLRVGTYYVKESVAPKGYALDPTIYDVNIKPGELTTKEFVDLPQSDPISILLGKVDKETNANKPQGSASLENAEFTVKYYKGLYDNDPAVQGIKAERNWVLKTRNDGKTAFVKDLLVSGDEFYYNSKGWVTLPLGTITIQETKAPKGYKINNEVFVRKITPDGTLEGVETYNEPTVKEEVIKGQIKIAKKDKDTGKVIQVAGTVFDIYFNGNKVSSMTTDKTGYAISEKLPYGQYVVKESKAPEGYLVDVNQQAVVDITAEKTYEGELQDKNVFGTVEVKKEDSVTGNTAQGEATLEGAVYGVYARENIMDPANDGTILHKKDEEIGRITTDAQAQGKLENLYLGRYYLKEITPSHGYTLDETEYPFDLVYEGQDVSVVTKKQTVKERVIAQAFSIIKISSNETDNPALLEGVEFTVKAQKDIDKYGSWEKAPIAMNAQGKEASVLVTDKKGYAVSDELPFGTYIVRETKAPEDHYAVQDFKVVIDEDSREPQVWRVLDDKEFKGYVQIVKKDADTGKIVTLNNASFQIVKYKKDGSVDANLKKGHIKTDGNGIVSIKNGLLWYNTFVTNADNRLSIVEQLGNYEGMPQEDKGTVTVPLMLPTGDYELMETNAPDGYLKGQTVRFSLKKGMVTGVDPDGDPLLSVVYKDPKPKGRIELTKQFEDPDYIMHGKVTFDLIVTKDIVDPADGTVLYKANDVYGTYELNKDTNKIVIENLPMGVGESHFKLVEKTTYENYVLNAQEYPVDFVQTDMGIPTYTHEVTIENKLIKIRTQALNADTKDNQFNSAKQITVTDVVSYEGLLAGQEYTMHGVLMDKETGEPVKNADGTIVEGYKKFTPEAVNGTVNVKMTLDASQLGGKDFVVFESVLNTGVEGHETCEIARHHDLTDKNQTITILNSKIGTTAKSENGSHEQQVKDDKVTFIDTVAYENLVAGMNYKVSGVLMDKTTGKAFLVDGKEVTSETTFTPETSNGTVDVTFEFDASAITSNTSLVVYERLVEIHTDKEGVVEEIDVAQHEDMDDEGQTIHFIDIKTTAQSDNGTNEQQPVDKEITFTDTVHYEGLQVGKEYTVTGKLMNKETNEPLIIDGKEVTSETTFKPEEANGTVDVIFTFNAKDLVAGQDIVVFEDLIRDEIKIASHADINDKDQTIHIIDVKTKASSEKDNHVGLAGKKVTITDTVSYTNLEVGKEYTVKGVLMNKETNEPLLDADGNQITGETTFTPEEANGTVDVIFTLDSSLLAGKEVVVFEDLYKEDIKVGSHADINDKDQTIKFKNYEIKVNKVDSLTKKNIVSNKFEFTMFSDKECEDEVLTVAGNTEDGTAVFEVKEGTWYIKETKAPTGYKLSKEVVKVEVKDDKLYVNDKEVDTDENYLYSIIYQNALLPSLQTGSENHGGMYFMMMCFSALAFAVFFMIRKSYLQ